MRSVEEIRKEYPVFEIAGGRWVYQDLGDGTFKRLIILNRWSDCKFIPPKILKKEQLNGSV